MEEVRGAWKRGAWDCVPSCAARYGREHRREADPHERSGPVRPTGKSITLLGGRTKRGDVACLLSRTCVPRCCRSIAPLLLLRQHSSDITWPRDLLGGISHERTAVVHLVFRALLSFSLVSNIRAISSIYFWGKNLRSTEQSSL